MQFLLAWVVLIRMWKHVRTFIQFVLLLKVIIISRPSSLRLKEIVFLQLLLTNKFDDPQKKIEINQ